MFGQWGVWSLYFFGLLYLPYQCTMTETDEKCPSCDWSQWACCSNDDDCYKLISFSRYTALHHAAQQGHINIVNILLDNKADANASTNVSYPKFVNSVTFEVKVILTSLYYGVLTLALQQDHKLTKIMSSATFTVNKNYVGHRIH